MRGAPLLMLLFGLVACGGGAEKAAAPSGPETPWRKRPGDVFVHIGTREIRNSATLLEWARAQGSSEAAVGTLHLLSSRSELAAVVEPATFELVELLKERDLWPDGFNVMLRFLRRRFPDTARTGEAKRALFDIAWLAIQKGTAQSWLFFGYSSDWPGIEMMEKALAEYPQEEFSPGYAAQLARYLFEQEEYRKTDKVCRFIMEQYRPVDEIFAYALHLLGEIEFRRFNGIPYDPVPLRDADKLYFGRILEEYPETQVAPPAQVRRVEIRKILAEKELRAGHFYMSKGKPEAAALYYRSVLREYPESPSAVQARSMLTDIEETEPAPPPPAGEDDP